MPLKSYYMMFYLVLCGKVRLMLDPPWCVAAVHNESNDDDSDEDDNVVQENRMQVAV